jgi:starch synthase
MLDIVMVMSEALPFSKSGGLGDVGGGLPLALGRLGHRVTLVLPRYRDNPVSEHGVHLPLGPVTGHPEVRIVDAPLSEGVRAWLVDSPPYFDRDGIYGEDSIDYPDNDLRFSLLARSALEAVAASGERPDLIHAHDWQAGLVPAYLATIYKDAPTLRHLPTIFTIHNLAYQGLFPAEALPSLGLGVECFTAEGLEFWGKVSFLKAGINYSTIVTTVSRKYAEEIQTPEQGFGFEGVLQRRADALVGIRNGIDTEVWNPRTDRYLPAPYDVDDLSGKHVCKQELLSRFSLAGHGQLVRPLIGMVARMVDQKGLDLIAAASSDLMQLGACFVVLGTGEPRYQGLWRELARRFPERVAATIGFDEQLAHLIEAGSDIFLMPSRFEPCGLNQMYSLRYGTVPVVHATGGLDDTVRQVDPVMGQGTGFKYHDQKPSQMLGALREAVSWFDRKEAWRRIQIAGMREDNSWDASARQYVEVYERAIGLAARGSMSGLKPNG